MSRANHKTAAKRIPTESWTAISVLEMAEREKSYSALGLVTLGIFFITLRTDTNEKIEAREPTERTALIVLERKTRRIA